MKIKNLIILALVLLGFTYCSSDDVLDGPTAGNETADNLKMEIAIQMPTGATTRTNTGDVTYKAGEANENMPNRVIVALYKESDQTFLASYDSKDKTIAAGGAFITTAEFTLGALNAGDKYYVYAFVNPYTDLNVGTTTETETGLNKIFSAGTTLDEAIAAVTKVGGKTGGKQENFFMSNSEKVLTEPIQASHIQGAPLKVGVNVQRAVARMDYKALTTGNTYVIANSGNISDKDVSITIESFKPMNASKAFYNLKHVNAGTDITADATALTAAVGVAEDNMNYVVDTDWTTKISGETSDDWKGNFHSYMGSTTTTKENYDAFQAKYAPLTKFYITENTMPAGQNNKKGVATAVVFKGYLNFDPSYVTTSDEDVYVWNNKFYGSFDKLPAGIQAIAKTKDEKGVETDNPDMVKDLASAGVTGYSHDGTGYPIYYVYYNVHNTHTETEDVYVGPMEFGVVRNNIYQLSITKLNKFGHPNDPELDPTNPGVDDKDVPIVINPDPSPQDPTHPIKSKDLYMQVTATVLDWTVRTNEIEF